MNKRQGGRAARRRSREAASTQRAPYIQRKIPPFEIVDDEAVALIQTKADQILAEVGMNITDDPESLELFAKAGAEVEGERVRFEPGLVQTLAASAPSEFTQHARNPDNNVIIGSNNVVFAPAYGSPFVRDLDQGRRYGTMEDFEKFVKLAHQCPSLHHSGGTICEPVDVPVNKRHLDMVYAHLRYGDKAFMGSVTEPSRSADSIEMARIVFGADFVEQNCVIIGNCNVNSPLVWDATMTGALKTYAAANQACVVVPFILGGAMGPVTTIGAVAQAHAETMVGVALTQLVRPGAPVIYGNFLSSMELRSGSPTFGTPEPALGSLVVGQLARSVGLPLRCSGAFTASKVPDGQAMTESAMSMLAAIHCGANFILHTSGWLEGGLSMGYEKFMMDADFASALHDYCNGINLDDDQFAIDAFHESGPGVHMLGTQHTLRHYENAFWDSQLNDNSSYEQWSEAGSLDIIKRANTKMHQLLDQYEPPPIDDAIDEALRDFVARRKSEMPDQFY